MITPTNVTKHSITPKTTTKSGQVLWDDNETAWDSNEFWDGFIYTITNITKHSITPTNQTKN